jgi:hypothetical protein
MFWSLGHSPSPEDLHPNGSSCYKFSTAGPNKRLSKYGV